MPLFIVRIYRLVPLIVVIVLILVAIFALVCTTRNATRAKEVVLRVAWWLCAVLGGFFALATIYAFFDGNDTGIELFGSSALLMGAFWLVDVVCGLIFRKHHAAYKPKVTHPKAKINK